MPRSLMVRMIAGPRIVRHSTKRQRADGSIRGDQRHRANGPESQCHKFPEDGRRIALDIGGVSHHRPAGCEHLGRRHARRIEGALERIDERESSGRLTTAKDCGSGTGGTTIKASLLVIPSALDCRTRRSRFPP